VSTIQSTQAVIVENMKRSRYSMLLFSLLYLIISLVYCGSITKSEGELLDRALLMRKEDYERQIKRQSSLQNQLRVKEMEQQNVTSSFEKLPQMDQRLNKEQLLVTSENLINEISFVESKVESLCQKLRF
jgi:hypothetical protein